MDSSFLAEAELDAALAEPEALVQALAWLPVVEEAAPAYFEVAALVAAAVVAVLAADALVAEPVAGAAATELVAAAAVAALAVDARAAELVADAAAAGPGLACSEPALAAGALAAELVAGAQVVAASRVWPQADSQAVGCDSAAVELAREQVLAACPALRRAVDCGLAEHFAGLEPIAGPRAVADWVVALR